MRRCAGARREHSQAVSPSWLMEILCTLDVMLSLLKGVGWGSRSLLFSLSSNPLFSGSPNFSWSCLFQGFCKIHKNPRVWSSTIGARGLAANWSLGGEEIVWYIAFLHIHYYYYC